MRTMISSWARMACVGAFGMGCAVARGQALPADVLACARQPDALQRLECYDQSVARHGGPHTSASAPDPTRATPAAPEPPRPAAASGVTPVAIAPAKTGTTAASPSRQAKRMSARIISLKPFPDAVVVSLDNGQVWEQIQDTGDAPNLHTGEIVSIDRRGGAYWLSDATGASMIVRETR